jgi:hypothetical protein
MTVFGMSSPVDRHHQVEAGMSGSDIHALYMLGSARLVVKNTVLQARLLFFMGNRLTDGHCWRP